jgi:hypothetical protein
VTTAPVASVADAHLGPTALQAGGRTDLERKPPAPPDKHLPYWPTHPDLYRPSHLYWGYHCVLHKRLWEDYGITCQDYWALFRLQKGLCALCKSPPGKRRFDVDHDHETGEIRGLLCRKCNQTITRELVAYILNGPGKQLHLVASGDRLKQRERRLKSCREKMSARRANGKEKPREESTEMDDFEEQQRLAELGV